MELADSFRFQSTACGELGSPMYQDLLTRAADDIDAGGVVRQVLEGHEHDPGPSALALRLLGSVHRLVLERRAAELALVYPSVGGTWDPENGWGAFRELLRTRPDEVRAWLERPPQTNEVGRSAGLYGGLLHLPRDLPLRLLEIGSSGGLNLNADRFGYVDAAGRRFGAWSGVAAEGLVGAGGVVVENAWGGRPLEPWSGLRVVERLGSDLRPLDPATTEGRLALTAYVWPDQRHRLERLRAALRVVATHPVAVRRQDARSFVDTITLVDGVTTVLWHSVMWQYLDADDQAAVLARLHELGQGATPSRRLAHLRCEPSRRGRGREHEFLVWLRIWPDGVDRVIGRTLGHGVPLTWE